jgi:hypothetical protein
MSLRTLIIRRLRQRTVESLVRMACWAALLALAILCASILHPMPLSVIFAMSVGHAIGGFAFVCYLVSILLDTVRRGEEPTPSAKVNER